MYLAYVDESGSPGSGATYTLGCVVMLAQQWLATFDAILGYRRFLRDRFRVPVTAELKANYLIHNGGPLRGLKPALSESARYAIYRGLMRLQPKVGTIFTFAVLVRQAELAARGKGENARDVAWEFLIQRLERLTTKAAIPAMIIHDEGDEPTVRKLMRRARRIGTAGSAFGTGSLARPALLLVDDPVPRQSHDSYLLQLADLVAFAAFRRFYPPPIKPGRVAVVPQTMWDELGDARFKDVSPGSLHRGIVNWPAAA